MSSKNNVYINYYYFLSGETSEIFHIKAYFTFYFFFFINIKSWKKNYCN